LLALHKNKLVYNLTTFTFLTFWDPNTFSAFCALIYIHINIVVETKVQKCMHGDINSDLVIMLHQWAFLNWLCLSGIFRSYFIFFFISLCVTH
jgi:hypothetical protein